MDSSNTIDILVAIITSISTILTLITAFISYRASRNSNKASEQSYKALETANEISRELIDITKKSNDINQTSLTLSYSISSLKDSFYQINTLKSEDIYEAYFMNDVLSDSLYKHYTNFNKKNYNSIYENVKNIMANIECFMSMVNDKRLDIDTVQSILKSVIEQKSARRIYYYVAMKKFSGLKNDYLYKKSDFVLFINNDLNLDHESIKKIFNDEANYFFGKISKFYEYLKTNNILKNFKKQNPFLEIISEYFKYRSIYPIEYTSDSADLIVKTINDILNSNDIDNLNNVFNSIKNKTLKYKNKGYYTNDIYVQNLIKIKYDSVKHKLFI